MTLIVDASAMMRLLLRGPNYDRVKSIMRGASRRLAPGLMLAEAGNALWKHARAGDLIPADAARLLELAQRVVPELIPEQGLAGSALTLAVEHQHPIYDCFYLALAEAEGGRLLTADQRLARLAADMALEVEHIGG